MAEMTFLVMKGVAFESGFGSGKFWLCLTEEEELFVLIVLSGSYNLPSYNVEYQFWYSCHLRIIERYIVIRRHISLNAA